jgi:hypothetical protein
MVRRRETPAAPGRPTPRYRDDRCGQIKLVLVLMQGHAGAGLVAVDQARIGRESSEAGMQGRLPGQIEERRRHRRPRLSSFGIVGVIAIAGAIGDPADLAAICHCHRHLMTARRHHMAKRRLLDDRP